MILLVAVDDTRPPHCYTDRIGPRLSEKSPARQVGVRIRSFVGGLFRPDGLGRRALRRLLVLGGLAALALVGALVGLRLAGPAAQETALGTVSVRVEPAWNGHVDAFIPIANWGVRADAFSAPLRLHVEPRSVDRQALIGAASGERGVLAAAEEDARQAARHALVRALLWALGGAFALGIAAALATRALGRSARRSAVWLFVPPALAALVFLAALLRAERTFDPTAFESPRFYARGAELAQLLEVAEHAQETGQRYSSSVHRTLAGYATLLNAGAKLETPETKPPSALISDLHGNRLVLGPLRRLFSGRPIFFAGDVGQRGSRAETRALIPEITALGRPVVAVSGNHDSRFIMRRLARAGVIVLTDRGRLRPDGSGDGRPVQRIAGIRVAGYPDPLEWRGDPSDPRRVFSFAERPNGEREYARAQQGLLRWFEGLRPRPEIVLIHQNGLAQGLARTLHARGERRALLILTGHDHRQHIDRYGAVLVVDAGTVGAGGVFGAGAEYVGVAKLQIPKGRAKPRAVDLIQVEPLSGAANAERIIVSSPRACERELVRCHDASGD